MWVERGCNMMMLHESVIDAERRILHTLLGLNRRYFFGFKWLEVVDDRLETKPENLISRLRQAQTAEPREGALILAALVEETYDLCEQSGLDIDVERLRSIFRFRRPAWGSTPPGP
jgi:hypothetical protein